MPLPYDIGGCLSHVISALRSELSCLFDDTGNGSRLFSAYKSNKHDSMSNKNKRADRRNVSVEKLQEMFAKVITEIAQGSDSLSARKGSKGIVIYVENHGVLNLTYSEKGGRR